MRVKKIGYAVDCMTEDGEFLDAVKILQDILRAYGACEKSDMIFEEEVLKILHAYGLISEEEA